MTRARAANLINTPPFPSNGAVIRRPNGVTIYKENLADALSILQDFDHLDIYGPQPGAYYLNVGCTVNASSAVFTNTSGSGGLVVGFSATESLNIVWVGGKFNGRIACCRGTHRHRGLFVNVDLSASSAFVQMYAEGSLGTGLDCWEFKDSVLSQIQYYQFSTQTHPQGLVLSGSTRVGTPDSPLVLVAGQAHAGSLLTLHDTVFLVPPTGKPFEIADELQAPIAIALQGGARSNHALPSYLALPFASDWIVTDAVDGSMVGTQQAPWYGQGSGGSLGLTPFALTIGQDGAQDLALPTGSTLALDVNVANLPVGNVQVIRPLQRGKHYSVSNSRIYFTADAALLSGDEVSGYTLTTGGPAETLTITAVTSPSDNTVLVSATAANTTKLIEYRHPNTGVYQDSPTLTAVNAATYPSGTVYARLKGSVPPITAAYGQAVVVAGTSSQTPYSTYASFNSSNYLTTGTVTGCKSFCLWVKASSPGTTAFFFDNRDASDAYWYNAGGQLIDKAVVNSSTISTANLGAVATGQWVKLYVELTYPFTGPLTLLNRWAEVTGSDFKMAADLASITLYDRVWTSPEQSAGVDVPAPTTGVLASHDFAAVSGTTVPDTSGNNKPATLHGPAPTITLG